MVWSSKTSLELSETGLEEGERDKIRKGWYCPGWGLLISAVVVVVLITLTALTVYFVVSSNYKKGLTPAKQWKSCMALPGFKQYCRPIPATTTAKTPTTKPPPAKPPLVTGLRLNTSVVPYHYNLIVQPFIYDDANFTFAGNVTIFVTCNETTDLIVLHSLNLTVKVSNIKVAPLNGKESNIAVARLERDEWRQFLKVYLSETLKQGTTYTISIHYSGILKHKDLHGMYLASYTQGNITKHMVVTQFETAYARRAMPCFDEPSFKATFNVSVIRKRNYTALSNMPRISTEERNNEWVIDVFGTSVYMSTYLLAIVVSDQIYRDHRTVRGTYSRVWARRDYIDQVEFALNVSGTMVEIFENYTGIPYPLPKIDHFAVPDKYFSAGAMENWGLVLYTESVLLYNPRYSTTSEKNAVAQTMSHELAHQWFGNLVTMAWWDDTWLNEGITSYFEQIGMAAAPDIPEDKLYVPFIIHLNRALNFDKWKNRTVFRRGLEHHSMLMLAFDPLSYSKGASLVRMVRFFLGEKTFKRAVRRYVRANAYKNVRSKDLFAAFEQQAIEDGNVPWNQTVANFSSIMKTWTEQPGYPLVTLTRTGNYTWNVTQRLDTARLPRKGVDAGRRWIIPFTYADISQMSSRRARLQWMYGKDIDITSGSGTIVANLLLQGYYRVNYDNETWTAIIDQLNRNHTVIPVENRAKLIDDVFSFALASTEVYPLPFKVIEYLQDEVEYLPWAMLVHPYSGWADSVLRSFENLPFWEHLQKFFLRLVKKPYDSVGWQDRPEEPFTEKLRRQLIVKFACRMRYGPCVAEAARLFKVYMRNPIPNSIPPDLHETVYCSGVSAGGLEEWEYAYRMYQTAHTQWIASEKSHLRQALACTREPWILQKYIKIGIDKADTNILLAIADKPHANGVLWDFLMDQWANIPKGIKKLAVVKKLAGYMWTRWDKAKLTTFVNTVSKASNTTLNIDTCCLIPEEYSQKIENIMKKLKPWLIEHY